MSDFNNIIKDLKNKQFKPVYLLHGEENFFIDQIAECIENNALTESEKAFNLTIIYASKEKDGIEPERVIEQCRRFPMMANHQVIIIKEAQHIKDFTVFENYIEKPVNTTILVICHKGKTIDGRTKLGKTKHSWIVRFEAKKLNDYKEIPDWIINYMLFNGFKINQQIANLLAEYMGNNVASIANELNKLIILKGTEKEITDNDIEKYVGISKEFNNFELVSSIITGNTTKAFYIGDNVGKTKGFSLIPFVALLTSSFAKGILLKQQNITADGEMKKVGIYYPKSQQEYRNMLKYYTLQQMENALKICAEYDLKVKGINQNNIKDHELLKEMLFKIFNRE